MLEQDAIDMPCSFEMSKTLTFLKKIHPVWCNNEDASEKCHWTTWSLQSITEFVTQTEIPAVFLGDPVFGDHLEYVIRA